MPDIDIGQLSEVINDKMDRDLNNRSTDSGLRRLIESYHNGTEWYKVFEEIQSDGTTKYWCEQGGSVSGGGRKTVTYLKPFADTNYTVVSTQVFNTGDYSTTLEGLSDKTPTSVSVDSRYLGAEWYACGYIS